MGMAVEIHFVQEGFPRARFVSFNSMDDQTLVFGKHLVETISKYLETCQRYYSCERLIAKYCPSVIRGQHASLALSNERLAAFYLQLNFRGRPPFFTI